MQNDDKKIKFAVGFCYNKYIWIFVISCFIGFIYETILGIFQYDGFISRQEILYGPFIPVYGLGAILFMCTLKNINNKYFLAVIAGIEGTVLEYIYSLLQERIFGTVSWDYSNYMFNFEGRTSLIHVVFWGIIGYLFIKYVYPFLSKLIEKVPKTIGKILSVIFVLFIIIDVFMSVNVGLRYKKRRDGIPAKNWFENYIDSKYTDEVIEKIYPKNIIKE